MATYVIGDVHGCYDELQLLLIKIQFDPDQDFLWFTGDIVNRGKQSLQALRFVKALNDRAIIVLGNHDLHLLAVYYGITDIKRKDTFQDVLAAPDCAELCEWLRLQPLIHHDAKLNFTLVHAGMAPQWQLQDVQRYAHEVETVLRSPHPQDFLKNMYGDQPDCWDDLLMGVTRWRVITNYLTRMRFCNQQGRLNLAFKGSVAQCPTGFWPWYKVPNRVNKKLRIIFGHWAALGGKTDEPSVFALDTGCCWGNSLTAMRLEDQQRFSVPYQGSSR